jgi:gluconolactonase
VALQRYQGARDQVRVRRPGPRAERPGEPDLRGGPARAHAADFDDRAWTILAPADTQLRLSTGRVCFNWYRITVTIPERVGDLDPVGCTVVFETVIDDYAEIWVNGEQPLALGKVGGPVVAGFNAPNRVVLTRHARPGQRFTIAVFGINGPISAAPANYIWMRTATLDFYSPSRARLGEPAPVEIIPGEAGRGALGRIVPPDARLERVAGGFEFTEGPVWTRDGALLFSSPNTNTIYRWAPTGTVTVFRPKSGYTGTDIGRYTQPGSNGLTFDSEARLTICQHGNRRVIRVEQHGNITVLAETYAGKRLNSPNDLVYASDGTLYFTDPPFGLPGMFADPKKELAFSGVYRVRDGAVSLITPELAGPNGIALSPDERYLYVGNWDPNHKIVMRLSQASGLTKEDTMSKGLTPGSVPPDFMLPDENGVMHRLSELQGDDAMILMLGRGEHCPRERQHQREMVRFHQWCPVAFTRPVTILPNDLHDVYKMRISTGAHWPFLADTDLEVQRAFEIEEYTDPHHNATVPHTLVVAPGPGGGQGVRRVLVLGPALSLPALGGPARPAAPQHGRLRPYDRAGPGRLDGSQCGPADPGLISDA